MGTAVNTTMLSETLKVRSGFTESAGRAFRLQQKKPMNLCPYDSEEREHGVGAGVNTLFVVYYEEPRR